MITKVNHLFEIGKKSKRNSLYLRRWKLFIFELIISICMMDGIIIAGLLIVIVLQVVWRPRKDGREQETLEKLFAEMQRSFERIEKNFREDFRLNREESRLVAKDNREELASSLRAFQESFERGIASFNQLQKEKFVRTSPFCLIFFTV